MNNTFDFRRFGKYFVSDLKNVFNNSALTVLLTGLSGVVLYCFSLLLSFVVTGSAGSYGAGGRIAVFVLAFLVLVVAIPARSYGYFTEKRKGSFFTLIPASALEKTVSAVLITCVIIPLAYAVIALGADSLLCLVDKSTGESIVSLAYGSVGDLNELLFKLNNEADFNVFTTAEMFISALVGITEWILIFLLGALYFKKNKAGKTILVIIGVYAVISIIFGFFAPSFEGLIERFQYMENVRSTLQAFKAVAWSLAVAELIGLLVWVYYRIKTVKF